MKNLALSFWRPWQTAIKGYVLCTDRDIIPMHISAHQSSIVIGYSSISRDIMVASDKLSFDDYGYQSHPYHQSSHSAPSWVLVVDKIASLDDSASIFHHLVKVISHGMCNLFFFLAISVLGIMGGLVIKCRVFFPRLFDQNSSSGSLELSVDYVRALSLFVSVALPKLPVIWVALEGWISLAKVCLSGVSSRDACEPHSAVQSKRLTRSMVVHGGAFALVGAYGLSKYSWPSAVCAIALGGSLSELYSTTFAFLSSVKWWPSNLASDCLHWLYIHILTATFTGLLPSLSCAIGCSHLILAYSRRSYQLLSSQGNKSNKALRIILSSLVQKTESTRVCLCVCVVCSKQMPELKAVSKKSKRSNIHLLSLEQHCFRYFRGRLLKPFMLVNFCGWITCLGSGL